MKKNRYLDINLLSQEAINKIKETNRLVKKINKYNATITEIDGIKFRSKKEAKRYQELKLLQKAGEVLYFIRQPKFDLPGGVTYTADFLVVWKGSKKKDAVWGVINPFLEFIEFNEICIEDVKGMKTKEFIMKKKMVESLYPVKIEVI